MSVQFGIWNFRGQADQAVVDALSKGLEQWGPDGVRTWLSESNAFGIGAGAFHVTHEDLRQVQPLECEKQDVVATFDGRIDNRFALMNRLAMQGTVQRTIYRGSWNPGDITSGPLAILTLLPSESSQIQPACWRVPPTADPTDIEVLAASYSKWNVDAFRQVRGDWAAVIWNRAAQQLWLAKDPFGPRHLHYISAKDFFCWSTRYEVLRDVIRAGLLPIQLTTDRVYQAANAVAMPTADATPFCEIRSVKPGSAISVRHGRLAETITFSRPPRSKPQKAISFPAAARLMKHSFERSLIARTRSAFPVTFELSGGCDSSTLVCLAHDLRRARKLENEIYTVTRYSPDNPNSQDLAYAELVEEHIGGRGRHIRIHAVHDDEDTAQPTAAELSAFNQDGNAQMERSKSRAMRALWSYRAGYTDAMREHGSRVLLSGVGGDELTGGVQFASLSLGELLRDTPARFPQSITDWARYKNETVWRLMWQTILEFIPIRVSSWIDGSCRRQSAAAHHAFRSIPTAHLRMMRYTFSGSIRAWRSRRRQEEDQWPLSVVLSHKQRLCHIGCWQRAFPFIEMEWVRICSILPPDYLQAAFQRRRLHRSSFAGVVPHEVLWRATKDFGPLTARRSDVRDRTLRDLEENASLQQILKTASRFEVQAGEQPLSAIRPDVLQEPKELPPAVIDDPRIFTAGDHVRVVISDQGATLLDTVRGKRVVLNPAGALIWQEMQAGHPISEISRKLSQRYDLSHLCAVNDTRELLEDLVQNGLIEEVSSINMVEAKHVQLA